ncbi:hypothetical protein [Isoptericola aurantiacus]|uniref:hypothetical protein n=1 Tax=Isoptericola aurantiacus TaxID=3377839 RepID=UPI003839E06C
MSATLTSRTWTFDAPNGSVPITQDESGRQITVEPITLTVTRHERWGLRVAVEGRWILRDGTYGRHRKSVAWGGDWQPPLSEAPEWVREAVTEVAR